MSGSDLERHYRALLRWYPRSWRQRSGDALVGTMLDVAESEGRSAPTRAERSSAVRHGLTARVDQALDARVRDAMATIGLSVGTGFWVIVLILNGLAPWGAGPGFPPGQVLPLVPGVGVVIITATWALALITGMLHRWPAGRLAIVAGIIITVVTAVTSHSSVTGLDGATATFGVVCGLLALLGRPRVGAGILGATLGSAVLTWTVFAYDRSPDTPHWQATRALWARTTDIEYMIFLVFAAATILTVFRLPRSALALALLATPLIAGLLVGTLVHTFGSDSLLPVAVTANLAILAVLLAQTNRRIRARRQTWISR